MHAKLEKEYKQLEAERKVLFNDLKQYSDEVLNKKPKPEAWSVNEVIAHLITAEEMSLKYLQKKLQDTSKAQHEGLKHKWRWLLVQTVFTFDIKFKAPAIVEPKLGITSLKELESRWSNDRQQIFETLSKLDDDHLKKDLWKHAVAGKLNLHHMVQFFGIHFSRHKKQIARTLAAVK